MLIIVNIIGFASYNGGKLRWLHQLLIRPVYRILSLNSNTEKQNAYYNQAIRYHFCHAVILLQDIQK
jgi:hypothetical protein